MKKNQPKQDSGLPLTPIDLPDGAAEDNAERKLLQKIYDTLSIGTNEYGHLTSAWMDTIIYQELEDFLYPSENK